MKFFLKFLVNHSSQQGNEINFSCFSHFRGLRVSGTKNKLDLLATSKSKKKEFAPSQHVLILFHNKKNKNLCRIELQIDNTDAHLLHVFDSVQCFLCFYVIEEETIIFNSRKSIYKIFNRSDFHLEHKYTLKKRPSM